MNIFVAKLDFNTTSEDLRAAFERFGEVSYAKVIIDYATGKSKGFGFVEMPDSNEANQAIQALNNSELDGRAIFVKEATPRDERTSNDRRNDHSSGFNRNREGSGHRNFNKGSGYGSSNRYDNRDNYRSNNRYHNRDDDRRHNKNNDRYHSRDHDRYGSNKGGGRYKDYDDYDKY